MSLLAISKCVACLWMSLIIIAGRSEALEIQRSDTGVLVSNTQGTYYNRRVKREVNRQARGFNDDEKYAMLKRHNDLRSTRRSSDMMLMEWDDALGETAQRYAERCIFRHSNNRDNSAGYRYIGENLYAGTSWLASLFGIDVFRIDVFGIYQYQLYLDISNLDFDLLFVLAAFDPPSVVQAWYDEDKYYNYNDLTCSDVCGHYTQVVWADSRALGCGYKYCEYLEGDQSFKSGYNVVCHYGPGGNYRGLHPYKRGEPCSQCPEEAKYCVQDLCALRPRIGSGSGSDKLCGFGFHILALFSVILQLLVIFVCN